MFENNSQSNFCATEYEHYNENVESYENISNDSSHWHSKASSSKIECNDSVESNFITYEIFENDLNQSNSQLCVTSSHLSVNAFFVNVMYKEKSEFNKRSHHEQIVLSLSISITFSITEQVERIIRKKSQKRVDKKSKSQSLMSMFDDTADVYEKSIFVRKVLKNHRINMSFLNWMTWSSETCKELKRLCTKITKKRTQKFKKNLSFIQAFQSRLIQKFLSNSRCHQ
jgi:hypothetical protein